LNLARRFNAGSAVENLRRVATLEQWGSRHDGCCFFTRRYATQNYNPAIPALKRRAKFNHHYVVKNPDRRVWGSDLRNSPPVYHTHELIATPLFWKPRLINHFPDLCPTFPGHVSTCCWKELSKMYSNPMIFPLDLKGDLHSLQDQFGNTIGTGTREVCEVLMHLITKKMANVCESSSMSLPQTTSNLRSAITL